MSKIVYIEDYKGRPQDALPKDLQAIAIASGAVRVSDNDKSVSGGVLIAPLYDGYFGVFVFDEIANGRVVPVRLRGRHTAYIKDKVVGRHRFKDFNRAIKKALAIAA